MAVCRMSEGTIVIGFNQRLGSPLVLECAPARSFVFAHGAGQVGRQPRRRGRCRPRVRARYQRDATYARSYTAEERRAFANHINDVLKDDATLKGALPMNPETDDLFKVREPIALVGVLTRSRAGHQPRCPPLVRTREMG